MMCDKLPYCNPRIDKCLISLVEYINQETSLKTISSCCGHGKYKTTIIVRDKKGNIFEYFTKKSLTRKKKNRYYKKDNEGYYYLPEVIE